MKRNQLTMLLLAATAMSAAVLTGCVTSGLQEVSLNIKAQTDTLVEVMPFETAKKRFATSDAGARGPIGVLLDQRTGLYTYKFDDKDYANLRNSVIESLLKGGFFKGVHDVTYDGEVGTGTRLYINFSESGMGRSGWGGYTCALNAYAWTEDATGNVLAKKEIAVIEKSGMGVGAAKNKAITQFVREVSGLFVTNSNMTHKN